MTGAIIEAVLNAGGDNVQLGEVIPVTLNPAVATEEARAAAVANAKSKASSYAKLLGTSIGKVLSLEEQSSPIYSSPFPMAKAGATTDAAVEIDLATLLKRVPCFRHISLSKPGFWPIHTGTVAAT